MNKSSASGEYQLGDLLPAEVCPACTAGCPICDGKRVVPQFIAARYRWAKRNGWVAHDGR